MRKLPPEFMKPTGTLILAVFGWLALAAKAQDTATDSPSTEFGGPSSVSGQVRADQQTKRSLLDKLVEMKAYEDFKKSLQRDQGISFGLDYNMLYQYAKPSAAESSAAGGVFR